MAVAKPPDTKNERLKAGKGHKNEMAERFCKNIRSYGKV